MFTTRRLRLRAYKSSDFEPLLDLHNDFGNATWLQGDGYIAPVTEENFKTGALKFFQSSLMFCVVEELETGEFVGSAMLFAAKPKNRTTLFGISLHPKFHNKGYGTEVTGFMVDYAFHNLGLHRVSLIVFSGNDRAIQVYKKVGFVEEGRARKSVWINGEWHDEIQMAILDEDWLASRAAQS